MLIHWPGVKGEALQSPNHRLKRLEAYKGLIKGMILAFPIMMTIIIYLSAKNEGFIRFIGVSNFTIRHLQELEEDLEKYGIFEMPYVNQVELHPLCVQVRFIVLYCFIVLILMKSFRDN